MVLPEWNSCGLETWHYLFVLYNPPSFFPLPLLFCSQCLHGLRQRNRMFLWHSQSGAWGFSENNRLIEEKRGAHPALFQQVERFMSNSWVEETSQCFPSCAEAGIQPRRHLDDSDQLPPHSRWQSGKWEEQSLKPGGGQPAQARSHTRRKTPRLIIITFYEHSTQSVSHSDTEQGCQCAM